VWERDLSSTVVELSCIWPVLFQKRSRGFLHSAKGRVPLNKKGKETHAAGRSVGDQIQELLATRVGPISCPFATNNGLWYPMTLGGGGKGGTV